MRYKVKTTRWINTANCLPELYKKVLCLLDDGDCTIGYLFDKDNLEWNLQCDMGTVAYWRYLPELPKGFKKED